MSSEVAPRRALILGPPESAVLISRRFIELGMDPVVYEERSARALPSLADPDASHILRSIFREFPGAIVHPGVSPWAERPELVTIAYEEGLDAIAPPARVLNFFSNKLTLFTEAERIGIPSLLLDSNPLHGAREIEQLSATLGRRFPFILRSVKGGVSPGHFVVQGAEDLATRLPLWLEQLRRGCGEAILVAERYVEGGRQIVVPFARIPPSEYDDGLHLFPWVDASLLCRNRKLIEFCPAAGLDPAVERSIRAWTRELTRACGYVGVGTLEFLVDGSRAYLVNASARLNVTFHLWEKVAGTSAVSWQLAAQNLSSERPEERPERKATYGIAMRIFAEDPVLQLPQPGEVEEAIEKSEWSFPSALAEASLLVGPGDSVSPASSGLIGLIWAWGNDRKQALTVAQGVLDEFWVAGSLQTNERFVGELLAHPWVREGIFHSGFVDEEFIPSLRPVPELLRLFAAVCAEIPRTADGPAPRWTVGDQWIRTDLSVPSRIPWVQGPEFRKMGEGQGGSGLGVSGMIELSDGRRQRVLAFPLGRHSDSSRWQVRIGAWTLGVRRVVSAPGPGKILAAVSGRIHSILFQEGAKVPAHEPLLMIESLGTLVPHALPTEVRIVRWHYHPEDQVRSGDELAEFESAAKS